MILTEFAECSRVDSSAKSVARIPNAISSLIDTRHSMNMEDVVIYQWYEHGFWSSYDDPTSKQIEQARKNGEESVILTKGQYRVGTIFHETYQILFDISMQKNIDSGACCDVRRLEGSVTGFDPIPSFRSTDDVKYEDLLEPISQSDLNEDTLCNICLSPFTDDPDDLAIKLPKCRGHYFHTECIKTWLNERHQCPYCKAIYGVIRGNCPPGEMCIQYVRKKLPGYSGQESLGTWMLTWQIHSGVQDESHVNPGVLFCGTTRVGYLPDTIPFRKVLKMLRIAWQRRLMFTVGTSMTTGMSNVVTWNGIHIRTEWHDRTGFGWPAPDYIYTVTDELKANGITEDQDE